MMFHSKRPSRSVVHITSITKVKMTQIYPSGVLLKDTAEAVIIPLKNGIISITRVYESLIDADVDPISGQCSNYTSIRQQIVETQQSLEESEQAASTGLKGLDQHIEKLTEVEGKCEQQIRDTESTLSNLRTEQMSNEKLLNISKSALEQDRHNLDSAEETKLNQEKRRRDAEIVTGVGGGLFLYPGIGWVAGTAMVIAGAVKMTQASDAIRVAQEDVRKFETEVENYKGKVSDYQFRISHLELDIRQKHDEVEQIRGEIQQVKEKRESVAEFQGRVRSVVHLLSDLSGKTRVVEVQTRRFILDEPVMKMMEEVMKAAEQIAGNELLCTEDIPQLFNTMKKNHQTLESLCTSHSNTEDQCCIKY
ncbi:uncharacterized protein LOC143517748 [Brachyhypopomus gauderio]|uniref:uncharacterized protein LOC143517748 n=1 Tax=Brachyhypopomus gauderio TaxID=698409 RepID=UPI00404189F6